LEKGRFVLELQTEFIKFDSFSDNQLLDLAAEDREVHDLDFLHIYSLGVSYGITPDTTIHAKLPYVYRNDIRESEPPDEVHLHGDAKGFGDLSAHIHHRMYHRENSGLGISLIAGLKFPTGKTSDKDNDGHNFEAEFQPGSGSWDPSFGIAVSKRLDNFSIDSNVLYTLVTEGTQDTDLGDIFQYNLALSYRAIKEPALLDLIIEANGQWIAKEETDGHKDPDSGGNIIYLSPGIRLSLSKSFASYISFGIPIVSDLNGEQNDPDYRIVFGINLSY
jgi:hypothetical protein